MSDKQAFPHEHRYGDGEIARDKGMTLRDYFAASVVGHLCVSPLRQEMTTQEDANYAYKLADAMLLARETI